MIISSLLNERLFFDFANQYYSLNDSIASDFIFSETDFIDFKTYLLDKDYAYKTETETALEELKKNAKEEEYFSALSVEYDILMAKMKDNKKDDLEKNKDDIKQILTGEIMSRYYYQKGRIKAGLNFDVEVEKAIKVLTDNQTYSQILTNE